MRRRVAGGRAHRGTDWAIVGLPTLRSSVPSWQHGLMSKQEHAVLHGARIVVVNRTGRMKGYDA